MEQRDYNNIAWGASPHFLAILDETTVYPLKAFDKAKRPKVGSKLQQSAEYSRPLFACTEDVGEFDNG